MTFHIKLIPAQAGNHLFQMLIPAEFIGEERPLPKLKEYLSWNLCQGTEGAGVTETPEGLLVTFPAASFDQWQTFFLSVDWLVKPYPTAR